MYINYKLKQIQYVKKIVIQIVLIIIKLFKNGYFINTSINENFITSQLKISDT